MSSNKNVLFIGNPGTGKSTIINGILGRLACKSGTSYGRGLTVDFDPHTHDDVTYMDTPGLADVKLREKAGEEIERALKAGGKYKIIFVMRTEAGRVLPMDIATIQTVLTAIKLEDINYSMLFNKVSPKVAAVMQNKGPEYSALMGTTVLPGYSTTSVFFNVLDMDLHDTDDVFAPPSAELMKFLRNAPEMSIAPTDVAKLETDEKKFEELRASLETQIEMIKNDKNALQERIDQANQRHAQQLEKIENDKNVLQARFDQAMSMQRQRSSLGDFVADIIDIIPNLIHRAVR